MIISDLDVILQQVSEIAFFFFLFINRTFLKRKPVSPQRHKEVFLLFVLEEKEVFTSTGHLYLAFSLNS